MSNNWYHLTVKPLDNISGDMTLYVTQDIEFTGWDNDRRGRPWIYSFSLSPDAKIFDSNRADHVNLLVHADESDRSDFKRGQKHYAGFSSVGDNDHYGGIYIPSDQRRECPEYNSEFDDAYWNGTYGAVEKHESAIRSLGFDAAVVRENGAANLAVFNPSILLNKTLKHEGTVRVSESFLAMLDHSG
jgi:hypothetical protein